MKFIKTLMVCSILITGLIITGCKKEKYVSRDTSGLKPPAPIDTTKPPVVDTSVVIDNADKTDGWQVAGGDPVLVTTGQKEGKGYIQGTIKSGQNFMQFIKTLPATVNTKATLSTGELKFWFYVQDVSLLSTDGQVQFSSAADPDKKRIGWGFDKILPTLKTGWNHLELKFRDAQPTGDGGPDLTAMNFIKIFFSTTAKVTADQNYGIDDIRAAIVPPPPPVVFDNCDKVDGWDAAGGTQALITVGQKEGTGYVQGTIKAGQNFMQFIKTLPVPLNTTFTKDNSRVSFWFNVADVSQLKADGQIQISSSGGPDSKRFGWALAPIIPKLKNGWNQITLDFADAQAAGDGEADMSAINYFKIFFWTTNATTADLTTGIDGIQFIPK